MIPVSKKGQKGVKMAERISVKEAAEVMGVSEQFIRIGLQRQLLPIGTAIKMSSRWTYYISPVLLEKYVKKAASGN